MRALVFLCLSLLVATPLEAARVSGVVVDTSGAPVGGAIVTAGSLTVTTLSDGTFDIPDAPDGTDVRVTARGFAPATLRVAGDLLNTRLVLQPAALVDAVVVTASRGEERLSTPAAATVVSSAELLTSAAGSLDDALRATPGFSLFRRASSRVSNPTTQGVTLRGVSGSGASRTLVLADGLPLNDPFGSWVYWNRVPAAAVDRVEIVRGATGDLYGADALGGVVQVLTFTPGTTRLRMTAEGGSHDTARFSGFGSAALAPWHLDAAGEWLRTDGVRIVGAENRGLVDVPADSDYTTGFLGARYDPGPWHAALRLHLYGEDRGNGTPLQVNTTDSMSVAGEAGGSAAGGAWLVRGSGGSQEYYQTFSAVLAARASERLTIEQLLPATFGTASGQWTRDVAGHVLLVGAEGKWTDATVEETRYSVAGVPAPATFAGGTESSGALFGRMGFSPREAMTVVLGLRGDYWHSTPSSPDLPNHTAFFLSPRASAAWRWSDLVSFHGSAYRAHRTPTLNELHRGFSVANIVTNPNPQLDPETLTGVEAGVLLSRSRVSARLTGFWNQLNDAVTNVTIATVGTAVTRQRQNTDTVRARGVEVEADIRVFDRLTVGLLAAATRSTFASSPAQPDIEGNRVPQVPGHQFGATITYVDPRGFTGSIQVRRFGSQFDDDLNAFELDGYGVVDMSLSQEVRRELHVFLAVENAFDTEYDVGRTATLRNTGWPRSVRLGVRVFLP